MDAASLPAVGIRAALLLAGLLVPGAAWMWALGIPRTVATCFAGSVVSLYVVVLGLPLAGQRISAVSLSLGLAGVTVLALGASASRRREPLEPRPLAELPALSLGGWTPIYVAFLAAAVWRGWHEPLAGPDIEFRWGYLAEQMLARGSLDFYPPRTAEHFAAYFWAESIPPGASALYAWALACAGGSQAAWTFPATVLQLWSVHECVARSAVRVGGSVAGRLALLAAAATPLLTWSVLLGQETGLTALALSGLGFALLEWRFAPQARWAALAGVMAVVGASAREYGLIFPALALVALTVARADRRSWLAFGSVAAVALVWPARTWLLTGNPFYSLSPGNLFPANPRFLSWISFDADAYGEPLRRWAGWADVLRYLAWYAPLAVIAWIGLAVASLRRHRDALLALWAVGSIAVLWATSVPYTNGGLFYSMRVLAPALALSCVALGAAGAAARPSIARLTLAVAGITVLLTLPSTLALPVNPLRTALANWPAFTATRPVPLGADDPTVALVLRLAGKTQPVVIADDPGYQRRFAPVGIRVVPLWSPQADWLFDQHADSAAASKAWRDSGVRFIVLTKWQRRVDYFNAHTGWNQPPFQVQVVGETPQTIVLAIGLRG